MNRRNGFWTAFAMGTASAGLLGSGSVATAAELAPAPVIAAAPAPASPDPASLNLRLEMIEFASDLKHSRSYREELLTEALKPFGRTSKTPANSGEMLDRMAVAMAAVDKEFAKGWDLYKAGKNQDALDVWKDQLNAAREEKSYKLALTRYYLAETYRLTDQKLESIFEYRSLSLFMPDKFSPAAMARWRAGEVFVSMDRFIRAHEEWSEFLKNYSTADTEFAKKAEPKVKEWAKEFGSLEGIIAGTSDRMKEVHGDLAVKLATGDPTQIKQKKIVSILDDLILTLEEKEKEKDCNCSGGGGGGGSSSSSGMGMGNPNGPPNGPATQSALPEGKTAGVGELNSGNGVKNDGGWGKLPPREKEKILQAIKVQFPDRYDQIIKEYIRNTTETGK